MTSQPSTVTLVSECLIKPLHDLSPEPKEPLYFTANELLRLNFRYTQQGLLFAKPSSPENKDFSKTSYLDDLKHSLSATLTHFHPLAARLATRIQDSPASYVIYLDPENSPGVKFIYAKTDTTISDVLSPTYVPLIVDSFFDLNDAISHDGHTLPFLSIKVTELTDGIFIGVSVTHLFVDGTSLWHFMSSWSELFKSKDQIGIISRPPVIKRGSDLIRNLPFTHQDQFIERPEQMPNLVLKRFFSFSSASVARLKKKANAESDTQKISSLKALSALLWRCVTRARRLPADSDTFCTLPVNNRPRMNPPLSEDYLGCPIDVVCGTTTVKDLMTNGLGWAAMKLDEAVTNHDDAAVKKGMEKWIRNPVVVKMNGLDRSNVVRVTNSPRFDIYGCEFGLGKPITVRSGLANKADGIMIMYPGPEGGGSVDVEICLLPDAIMDLERDEEFISALSSE
uniref:uncharacterized acetyltransferase At3g50280-like n=1 Tax=Erigeron canadensis TaxID=72917 RepID=UPI001CB8B633|nr:uncharacterized acetyltransferase At3g50280-like [Erigeron canadensis]